jgi:multimeric flavodoxin WrbA
MGRKYVLILKGSPRENGNSSTLADRTAAGAKDAGAKVESYDLHKLNIRPCDACDICQGDGGGECIIDDDMQMLYPKLRAADAIVLASPIYWFTMSAQLKLCIDRWYALEGSGGMGLKGKQLGVLLAYGDTDLYKSGAINAIRTFQDLCRYEGTELVGMVYGSAMEAGEIQNQENVTEDAYNLGQRLGRF